MVVWLLFTFFTREADQISSTSYKDLKKHNTRYVFVVADKPQAPLLQKHLL